MNVIDKFKYLSVNEEVGIDHNLNDNLKKLDLLIDQVEKTKLTTHRSNWYLTIDPSDHKYITKCWFEHYDCQMQEKAKYCAFEIIFRTKQFSNFLKINNLALTKQIGVKLINDPKINVIYETWLIDLDFDENLINIYNDGYYNGYNYLEFGFKTNLNNIDSIISSLIEFIKIWKYERDLTNFNNSLEGQFLKLIMKDANSEIDLKEPVFAHLHKTIQKANRFTDLTSDYDDYDDDLNETIDNICRIDWVFKITNNRGMQIIDIFPTIITYQSYHFELPHLRLDFDQIKNLDSRFDLIIEIWKTHLKNQKLKSEQSIYNKF